MIRTRTDRVATLALGLAFAAWWLTAATPDGARPALSFLSLCGLAVALAFGALAFVEAEPVSPELLDTRRERDQLAAEVVEVRRMLDDALARESDRLAALAMDDDEPELRERLLDDRLVANARTGPFEPDAGPSTDVFAVVDTAARSTLREVLDDDLRDTSTSAFYAVDEGDERGPRHRA